jgi:4-oxalocrotonate tautomerase
VPHRDGIPTEWPLEAHGSPRLSLTGPGFSVLLFPYSGIPVSNDLVRRSKMPIIIMETTFGKSEEQKRKVAREMTEVVARNFEIPKEWVQIVIHEVSDENRANAGVQGGNAQDPYNIIS